MCGTSPYGKHIFIVSTDFVLNPDVTLGAWKLIECNFQRLSWCLLIKQCTGMSSRRLSLSLNEKHIESTDFDTAILQERLKIDDNYFNTVRNVIL